ncbi:Pre-mRNA-splicing factor cwf19 [Saxophila tyrrhenica]|uniref:Pre-mRNA-splicing factor cwf19 n=1 Tax=Saxophila tyrrhenica TaxID=1690608 RepID=A0AAV9P683_9PEZI|nr:Pre-mRNA-splicing factor cwf19 [Saxophila tyrrhenica]
MGLSDFERELAEEKSESTKHRSRSEKDGGRERKHRHHHRSHKHREDDKDHDEERRRRHKRDRDHGESEDGERRRYHKRRRSTPPEPSKQEDVKVFDSDGEDEWVEKEAVTAPPEEDVLDERGSNLQQEKVQRDAWMQEPSGLDIEYTQSRKHKAPQSQFVGAKEDHGFKMQTSEVNQHLRDLEKDFDDEDDKKDEAAAVENEPAQHEVSYTFGNSGSSWRMKKLQAIYRQAKESGKSVDDVALERYGDLRDFDDAREEEREMDRRKMYGKEYVGLEKPSGELFQERKMKAGVRRESGNEESSRQDQELPQGERVPDTSSPPAKTAPLDSTALNKLKAQLMKAKLRKDPNTAQLEKEYNLAEAASLANTKQNDVVVLNNMENRALASGRGGEVTSRTGKRAQERGLVTENEDMSIEDMVKQERRSARGAGGGGSGREFAERIAKDGKFTNNLDYMDDNATNLSKNVIKSDSQLRNTAIEDFQRMQRTLDSCPLCHHEDKPDPLPTAPLVSLATRTFLTLPTEPELAKLGAVIVPIQHRLNLLECDDDEWEEIRNFMKSLTRLYDAHDRGVLFYENAAHTSSRKGHAALNAIPLPHHLAETAPMYFKEAILAQAEQWSQHKPIIDTLALSQKPGYGRQAFRKAMVKEMPYFHVFFSVDGGLGHVVEDERKWPKGDLFAREVIGGMLDKGVEVVKKQGRWERGDRRVEGFRKTWGKWDWTKVLMEG